MMNHSELYFAIQNFITIVGLIILAIAVIIFGVMFMTGLIKSTFDRRSDKKINEYFDDDKKDVG